MRIKRSYRKTSLQSLKHNKNCLSISATTSPRSMEELSLHRGAKDLVSKLSTYFDDVSEYLSDQVVGFANRNILIFKTRSSDTLANVPYNDLYDVMIPVIPGLSVKVTELVKVLEEMEPFVSRLYDGTLYPFSLFVGQVINDPRKLQSNALRQDIKLIDYSPMQDKLGQCMRNGNRDTMKYGKAYGNNTEYTTVSERVNALLEKHKTVSPDLISTTVKEIDANLTILMEKIQDPDGSYRVTPQKVKELAEACFGLANEVTAYSTYTVILEQLVNTVNLSNKALEKVR